MKIQSMIQALLRCTVHVLNNPSTSPQRRWSNELIRNTAALSSIIKARGLDLSGRKYDQLRRMPQHYWDIQTPALNIQDWLNLLCPSPQTQLRHLRPPTPTSVCISINTILSGAARARLWLYEVRHNAQRLKAEGPTRVNDLCLTLAGAHWIGNATKKGLDPTVVDLMMRFQSAAFQVAGATGTITSFMGTLTEVHAQWLAEQPSVPETATNAAA